MNDRKWLFLRSQFLANAVSAALGRANVYQHGATEENATLLGETLRSELLELAGQYTGRVPDDDHVRNIRTLADRATARCGTFLDRGHLRFGVAQKALNLYLKFLWCADRIPAPPHCPFDSFVIGQLPSEVRVAWTKIEDEGPYLKLVKAAEAQAGDKSLAEWELSVYAEVGRR